MIDVSKKQGLDWVDRLADEAAERNAREGNTAAEVQRLRRLLRNVVNNVDRVAARRYDRQPLWALVRDVFAVGSTSAKSLCLECGWNPDATVRACRTGKAVRS